MNSVVFVVFDSARFDHVKSARTPNLRRLGKLERRYSYASWTTPSHASLLMGQMPHLSPKRELASQTYQRDFLLWRKRTGVRSLRMESFLPDLCLAGTLKDLGYQTHALVSLPVLNPKTTFARAFDTYRLMERHNEFHRMIPEIRLESGNPSFYFLNLGEAHYPYLLPGESDEELPRLHGLHGALRHSGDRAEKKRVARLFSKRQLLRMKERQIAAIEYLDAQLGLLFERCPRDTHVIVTSDHGELFGEDGFFGHGPTFHPKVFEVPFAEGRVP